jgi:hypothetical protein
MTRRVIGKACRGSNQGVSFAYLTLIGLIGLIMSSGSLSTARTPSPTSSDPGSIAPIATEDCLPCKLIGAGAFSGLGVYSLVLAKKQGAFARIGPAGKSLVASRIQAVLGFGKVEVNVCQWGFHG